MPTMPLKNKEHKREYERNWRRNKWANDPEYKARKQATDLARRNRLLEEVQNHKLEHGCSRCGFKSCARALSFHHYSDDKEHNIADMVHKGASRARIWAEISKCELVCTNCHLAEGCTCKNCIPR